MISSDSDICKTRCLDHAPAVTSSSSTFQRHRVVHSQGADPGLDPKNTQRPNARCRTPTTISCLFWGGNHFFLVPSCSLPFLSSKIMQTKILLLVFWGVGTYWILTRCSSLVTVLTLALRSPKTNVETWRLTTRGPKKWGTRIKLVLFWECMGKT